jgi:hypothetical protein
MNEPEPPITAIRGELFRRAETINNQLLARFADVADHLNHCEDRSVIGALEGSEADIAKMRSLMLLARDCFPLPQGEPQ